MSDADIREFRLPDLGEGLEEGEIVAWLVDVGEPVALNQPIVEVETAKAVVSVPSPFAGVVDSRVGEVGETLAVGSVLLRIRVGEGDGAGVAAGASQGATGAAAAQDTAGVDTAQGAAGADVVQDAAASDDRSDAAAAGRTQTTSDAEPAAVATDTAPGDNGAGGDADPRPLVGYGQASDTARRRRPVAAGGVASSDRRPLAKPPVRKLARDLGVDLADVAPTGPNGTITRDDVRAAAVATATGEADGVASGFRGHRPGDVEPIRAIRKRIVDKMERAHREIPVASATRDVDLTRLWDVRHELTEQAAADGAGVKITPFTVLLRATVLGLRRFPSLNARIVDRDVDAGEAGRIELFEHIHLGVAVDTERGLVVPTIKHAEDRSLVDLAVELTELAARARDGSIAPGDLTGGTFTVNNYGVFGNDDAFPIINHPEAGILGIGAIRERPWVVDGQIVARRVATLRLAFDHRVCDGGEAGRFVTYVADLCEEPTRILLHA